MAASPNVKRVCSLISTLTLDELLELRHVLAKQWGPEFGGGAGVREPRRPIRPLDARGVAIESETGKTDP